MKFSQKKFNRLLRDFEKAVEDKAFIGTAMSSDERIEIRDEYATAKMELITYVKEMRVNNDRSN